MVSLNPKEIRIEFSDLSQQIGFNFSCTGTLVGVMFVATHHNLLENLVHWICAVPKVGEDRWSLTASHQTLGSTRGLVFEWPFALQQTIKDIPKRVHINL
jgi:hypothetical protein